MKCPSVDWTDDALRFYANDLGLRLPVVYVELQGALSEATPDIIEIDFRGSKFISEAVVRRFKQPSMLKAKS